MFPEAFEENEQVEETVSGSLVHTHTQAVNEVNVLLPLRSYQGRPSVPSMYSAREVQERPRWPVCIHGGTRPDLSGQQLETKVVREKVTLSVHFTHTN